MTEPVVAVVDASVAGGTVTTVDEVVESLTPSKGLLIALGVIAGVIATAVLVYVVVKKGSDSFDSQFNVVDEVADELLDADAFAEVEELDSKITEL